MGFIKLLPPMPLFQLADIYIYIYVFHLPLTGSSPVSSLIEPVRSRKLEVSSAHRIVGSHSSLAFWQLNHFGHKSNFIPKLPLTHTHTLEHSHIFSVNPINWLQTHSFLPTT